MSTNYLSVVRGKTFPLDAVTQKFSWVGRSGSGKSYGAGKFAEELLEHDIQTVILDPVGIWYGLRMNADGKAKGYSIPIFGGEHGDVPLPAHSGTLIANLIVERGISAILDVSYLRKNERKQFVTDFAEQFFHLKKKNKSAVHLIIEEAQVFIPQRTIHGEERMLGAMEDIIKIGRNYGIGVSIISQRPQSVHKDCLNQTEALFAFQLNAVHERKAIKEWVEENCFDQKTQVEKLSTLEVGECFLWSPQWLKILDRVKILPKKTFDASKTPTMGHSKSIKSRALAPVDLEKIKIDMESVIKEKKENDPSELKKKIYELEKQLKGKSSSVQVPVKDHLDNVEFRRQLMEAHKKIAEYELWKNSAIQVIDVLSKNLSEHREKLYGKIPPPMVATKMPKEFTKDSRKHEFIMIGENRMGKTHKQELEIKNLPKEKKYLTVPFSYGGKQITEPPVINGSLGKCERNILIALAQRGKPSTKNQIGILAGYAITSGSFNNSLSRLRTSGYVKGGNENIIITEDGLSVLGHYEPLPEGQELQKYWISELGKAESAILNVLVNNYPQELTKEQIAEECGYAVTSGSFNNSLSKLRTLELAEGRKEIKASESLFG